MSKETQGRSIELDFLRGIAILLVCLGHHSIELPAGYLRPLVYVWHSVGWTGVDLFFVLSGFLIGGLLMVEQKTRGEIDVVRFAIRRGFKIWPLYFVYLALATFAHWRQNGYQFGPVLGALLPNYLHVQNYYPTPLQHTWSLAVEEHFYLGLPLLMLVLLKWFPLPRAPLARLPVILMGVIILCPALRCLNIGREFAYHTHQWPTHLRIDSLCWGVLLAYAYHFRPEWLSALRRHPWICTAVAFVLLAPLLVWNHHSALVFSVGFSVIALAYTLILISCYIGGVGGKLHNWKYTHGLVAAIAHVGVYSYPIYLFHFRLGQLPARWLLARLDVSGWPTLAWLQVTLLNLATIVLLGVLFGRLAEGPMLALRNRLFPARAALT